ncbi:hypothetical protein [Hydrogenivirga sp.]
MRKISISKLLLLFGSTVLLVFIYALFAVPKAVVLDRVLSEQGLHLMAGRVEEGVLSLSFERFRLYSRGTEILNLDKLGMALSPSGLRMSGTCAEGRLYLSVGWDRSLKLELKDFRCSPFFEEAEGNLRLSEGIFGRLRLVGIEGRGIRIDSASLDFRGENFNGDIVYAGMTLTGGGRIRLDRENPENTLIDASFKGSIGTVVVKGTLKNISVQLR